MIYLLYTFIVLLGIVIGHVIGGAIHKLIHWKGAGFLFEKHRHHHFNLYPTHDFFSEIYRDPGKDNTVYVFAAFIAAASGIMFLIAPVWVAIVWTIEWAVIGLVNDWLHTAFHIRGHKLEKYKWFHRLRRLHYWHHKRVKTNLGIYSFEWDKLWRSFFDPKDMNERDKNNLTPIEK